jgi:hypothetical protein
MIWLEPDSFEPQTIYGAPVGGNSAVREVSRYLKRVVLFLFFRICTSSDALFMLSIVSTTSILLFVSYLVPESMKSYVLLTAIVLGSLVMLTRVSYELSKRIGRIVRGHGPMRCLKTGRFCLNCDDVCQKAIAAKSEASGKSATE